MKPWALTLAGGTEMKVPHSQGRQVRNERGSGSVSSPCLSYQIEIAPSLGSSDCVSEGNPNREETASPSCFLMGLGGQGNVPPSQVMGLLAGCVR